RYVFGEVAEGTHQITATRDGRIPYAGTVTITAGERTEHDLRLDRYQIAVTGDYRDQVSGLLRQAGYVVETTTVPAIAQRPGDYQVVVVNGHQDDPGEQVFRQFLANADAAGTSVVFLGSSGGNYNPLGQLSRYTGDPAQVAGGGYGGEV